MGILYASNEKHTKYFHHGYIVDTKIDVRHDLELYSCKFLRKGERRIVRKMRKDVLYGATFDHLSKLRMLTYDGTSSIPPYLLKVYNMYEDAHSVHVVMERCSGGFMTDSLLNDDSIISERLLGEWFFQIIIAMSFLEEQNIHHGNLNGYCIYFKDQKRDEVRVSLLSKNKKYDNIDYNGDLYGLFFIRSPQEIKKLNHDKNNTWYIGLLLYFMLTGSFPFFTKDALQTYSNIAHEEVPLAHLKNQYSKLGSPILDFLRQCLEKDYDLRPSLDELAQHPWIRDRDNLPQHNIVEKEARKAARELIYSLENGILKTEKDYEDEWNKGW
ncbi:serine/threonine protein kinase [Plasmodium inui San Antonio 1]|uniref:Serine/threonine protein kinase n=1 Tax=Plasmodium inui San Antonio 1 TaxID=1237626 RepID=W7A2C7_9APIC|nr:serine/threonine protein kinase [Plasmodium inui San Antonio 1]EUD67377.1 serine/threonine protein kinase [Plasmodium inui San Antonio 1]